MSFSEYIVYHFVGQWQRGAWYRVHRAQNKTSDVLDLNLQKPPDAIPAKYMLVKAVHDVPWSLHNRNSGKVEYQP